MTLNFGRVSAQLESFGYNSLFTEKIMNELFSLQNPLFRDVFIDTLKTLSVEGESFEIALYALKLQTALQESEKVKE